MAELSLEGLSVKQLEELIEEQDTEEGKEAVRALLERRVEMDEKLAKAPRRGNRSGAGRAPTNRHLAAVEHFNAAPEKLARLKKALAEAVDENGEPILSVELIRIGIGAYYDQRKRDDEAKAQATAQAGSPDAPQAIANAVVDDEMGAASETDLPEATSGYEPSETPEDDPEGARVSGGWDPEDDDENPSFPGPE